MVELLAVHLPLSRLDNPDVRYAVHLDEDDMPCSWRIITPRWFLWLALLGAIHVPALALAQTQNLNLAWNPSPGVPPASYHVHVGTAPRTYNVLVQPVPGTQTAFVFPASPGVRYYFAVQAVNAAGVASPLSDEVSGGVPTFTQPANRSGIVGAAISAFVPEVADPDGGTLAFSATGLPAGLAINASTGRVTGVPLSAGATSVTISVFDGTVTVQRSFTWTITGPMAPSVSAVSVSPNSGSGASQRFALQYSDSAGAVDLATAAVRFGASSGTLVNACALSFDRAAALLSLLDDDGRTWMAASLGSGRLQNSQCAVDLSSSSAAVSGTTLTLTLSMSFEGAFAGAKNLYMQAVSGQGSDSGWQNRGTWTVPAAETTLPALAITSHTNNESVTTASITLSGTASDAGTGNSGIASVTVNGTAAAGGSATGSGIASWSRTVSLASGANVLTVVATDGAGNARQRQITITRAVADATRPAVAITSHSNNQAVTTASITLSGTATDSGLGGSGISSVTVNGVAATGGTATGSGTASWSRAVALNTGSNQLTVVARDGAGNTRQVQITITRTAADSAQPAVTITSHSNNQTVTTASITLRGTATDSGLGGSGISSVTVNGVAAGGGTATGSGTANWSRAVALGAGSNQLTVVARDGAGNTRQVQITVRYQPAVAAVDAVSVTPSSGSGTRQTFTLRYSDTLGASDLDSIRLRIGVSSATGAGNCTVRHTPGTSVIALLDDAGATWISRTLGSGRVENSQCAVDLASTSVGLSGTVATLTASIEFKPGFAGAKSIYMFAQSVSGVATGWVTRGSWSVPGSLTAPGVDAASATPSAGSGATQTFALEYADNLGAGDLASARVRFGTTETSGANNCTVSYAPSTSTVSMLNDAGTAWLSAGFGAGVLQNSQCAIDLQNSSVTVSGSVLRMRLAVTFRAAFAGTKNIYLFAQSSGGHSTGWVRRGAWTVPGAASLSEPATPDADSYWWLAQLFEAFR